MPVTDAGRRRKQEDQLLRKAEEAKEAGIKPEPER